MVPYLYDSTGYRVVYDTGELPESPYPKREFFQEK